MELFQKQIRVDHFKGGSRHYLLTHYHSDHMVGLRKRWSQGTVRCTATTASLLKVGKELSHETIEPIKMDVPFSLDLDGGPVKVTALDANHCPGACMLLFERDGERTLVTGDFRLNDAMRERLPGLEGIDHLYVDATYKEPGYDFPPQEKVIQDILAFVDTVKASMVVVETYNIGKNKILKAIYDHTGERFYLDPHRRSLYSAIGYGNLVTDDPHGTRFFACSRKYFRENLSQTFPHWERDAVIISPIGWTVKGRWTQGKVAFPYSEHCSWDELREFVGAIAPKRITVTEGGKVTKENLSF